MTTGAVLCGGSSRRMGTDKAFVEIDGVAMAERVARALIAGGCEPVVFVGGDSVGLARFGRPAHADRWPGEGPLGGVLTALAVSHGDDVVVAACDLPFLDGPTVRHLLGAVVDRGAEAVDVVVARTDRLEPALAWWSAAAAAGIARQWDRGERALHEVIGAVRSVEVAVDGAVLRNINSPSDLPP
jgi:molybdopterin-guanine dinucleotide biosynthesis protein A